MSTSISPAKLESKACQQHLTWVDDWTFGILCSNVGRNNNECRARLETPNQGEGKKGKVEI